MTDEITDGIIGAAIEVHKALGPGLLETIYESALCHEFLLRSINFERQAQVDVMYKNIIIKGQRIDLLVEKSVVVELKSTKYLSDIFIAQTLSYLKATDLHKALLINFGQKRLVDGIKRISL